MKQAKEFTRAAHQLHSKVSISQFGCALDPYNTLKHIEADYVRLDGSFVEEVDKGDACKEQLKAMVKGLQNAGKITIIPDVQHAIVLALLYQAGVNFIQGNYLQAPSPAMNYDFGAGRSGNRCQKNKGRGVILRPLWFQRSGFCKNRLVSLSRKPIR